MNIEDATSGSDGYSIDYTYDLAGNRFQRVVTIGGQVLTTDYSYDNDTDRLKTETHSGPTTCMVIGNERYYAYSTPSGGFYYLDTTGNQVSGFEAFVSGLPSAFNQWAFRILMALIPIALFWPVVANRHNFRSRRRFFGVLFHRGVCVLLAYVFLISPEVFHQLAHADIAYSDLCTLDWAKGGETVYYQYDANGSMTQKLTALSTEQNPETNYEEKIVYTYNLQNRLSRIETYDDTKSLISTVAYQYNDEGVRVAKIDDPDGTPAITSYLIDAYNHTGYAQVLEETTGTDVKHYLIGDDVLAQKLNANSSQYLLYDGHGSTRQLVNSDGSTIADSYSYDAYGVMLGGNPTTSNQADTNLLYAGEQYDTHAKQYYLRARYYNQNNGTFNRVDDFAGNIHDPQSLHKYLYVHNNPVNAIDPSGMFSLIGLTVSIAIISTIAAAVSGTISMVTGGDFMSSFVKTFMTTFLGNWLAFALAPIGLAYLAFPLSTSLVTVFWDWYVKGETDPTILVFNFIFTFIFSLAWGRLLKAVVPGLSYDVKALGEIATQGGLGEIVREVTIETGKGVAKGVAFSAFPVFLKKVINLFQSFYKKKDYFIKRYDEYAIQKK